MSVFLITRPKNKNESLVSFIEKKGFKAFSFPLLNLQPLEITSSQLSPLIDADKLIFISQDAVKSLAALSPVINPSAIFFAVGDKTAQTILEFFNKKAVVPNNQDSEGLLELKSLQDIDGDSIVLIKGKGGRPLLAKTLKERRARLNTLNIYQRQKVVGNVSDWFQKWQQQKIDSIVLTSNAAVDVIFSDLTVKGCDWLRTCQFYVVSERTAKYLKTFNVPIDNIHNCNGASDEAILSEVIKQNSEAKNNFVKSHIQEASAIMSDQSISEKEVKQPETANKQNSKPKGNTVAILSLLIALGAAGGFAFNFYSNNQQQALVQQLQMNNQSLEQSLNALKAQIQNNSANLTGAIKNELTSQKLQVETALNASEKNISEQLENSLNEIKNIKVTLNPQEVRSLHRMAEFKAKVEKDFVGAVDILTRLDSLLSEHSDTSELRAVIAEDIQMLKGLSNVPVQDLYLKLHGLLNQVDTLPLNMVKLPSLVNNTEQEVLSEDISDWQANLKHSWSLLVDDFIKVNERTEKIEPLLTKEEQSLIRQQVRFYISQSQTALQNQQVVIYKAALEQANKVLASFFDTNSSAVHNVNNELNQLKSTPLNFNPQLNLASSQLMKEWSL
ncbi:uroporphyrinogen-III C-methyltransferase [Pseudoalteromonas denitrificans]|uniref:Uroporphyrinogen III methyltransferase / synthase n=1 Tax=Pseudoalteromonas denitrificans DSM 6059 TaxID=1123010 RepID=A0A1I1SGK4_9GAMM|nr:uroporphyrinogen-III C-methyltransferase [Pseudoalteromonas denitrificans]SFD45625.1 uroporphyrinogen III methyltransferase / synthase [Pseudoalteromonas denitrificans DSM 6059]